MVSLSFTSQEGFRNFYFGLGNKLAMFFLAVLFASFMIIY